MWRVVYILVLPSQGLGKLLLTTQLTLDNNCDAPLIKYCTQTSHARSSMRYCPSSTSLLAEVSEDIAYNTGALIIPHACTHTLHCPRVTARTRALWLQRDPTGGIWPARAGWSSLRLSWARASCLQIPHCWLGLTRLPFSSPFSSSTTSRFSAANKRMRLFIVRAIIT